MSQFFLLDGRTLWNPGERTALVYVGIAAVVSEMVQRPVGFEYNYQDEYIVDAVAFSAFVDAAVDWSTRTGNLLFHALVDGFIAASLVMADRGGMLIPSLQRTTLDADAGGRVVDVQYWLSLRETSGFSMAGD